MTSELADSLIDQALQLQGQGNVEQAAAIFRRLVDENPGDGLLRHRLSVAYALLGRFDDAYQQILAALERNVDSAEIRTDMGNFLRLLGRPDESVVHFQRAIELDPAFDNAPLNLARVFADQARWGEAAAHFETAIRLHAQSGDVWVELGAAQFWLNQTAEAERSFEEAEKIGNLGLQSRLTLGHVTYARGRYDVAIRHLILATQLDPDSYDAWLNYGACAVKIGRFDEANAAYQKAIEINSEGRQLLDHLAALFYNTRRWSDAIEIQKKILELEPGNIFNRVHMAASLMAAGREEEAVEMCDSVPIGEVGGVEALINRASALTKLRRLDEAIANYRRAFELSGDRSTRYMEGMVHLSMGDFPRGWALYEDRWLMRTAEHSVFGTELKLPDTRIPKLVHPDQLDGKIVCLVAEQGFGDTLQFVRYVALVKARARKVVLYVPEALVELCRSVAGADTVLVEEGAPSPDCEVYSPLLSLPLVFDTRIDTIPAAVPYIHAAPGKVAEWQRKLGAKQKLRVGLTWSGNPNHLNDYNRSIVIETLAPLFRIPGIEFFSLQQTVHPGDLPGLQKAKVRHFGKELRDFSETAALCSLMDLVLSIDTSIAHLAGALAKPLWLLLPWAAEWRWLEDREDSPWYPTARLFRQSHRGDWGRVIQQVETQMRNHPDRPKQGFLSRLFA